MQNQHDMQNQRSQQNQRSRQQLRSRQHRSGKPNLHKPNQNRQNRGTTPQEHVAYWPQFLQLLALRLSSQ